MSPPIRRSNPSWIFGAKIYDMQHDEKTKAVMTVVQDGEEHAVGNILPKKQEDWWKKRKAVDTVMDTIGGVVTRVGDETVGEMWSLYDGQDVLNQVDPQFSENIRTHIVNVLNNDPFHVSANTDPKETAPKRRRNKTRICCCMR